MSKLIQAYIADPSDKNLIKIRKHITKHPFAAMMITKEEALAIQDKI